VGSHERAVITQLVKVLSNGLGRNIETLGQIVYRNDASGTRKVQNFLQTNRAHAGMSLGLLGMSPV